MPLAIGARDAAVRTVFRNFTPAFVSRGVLQISAYLDQVLASLLPFGAVAALGYAQTLYTLPVSLFGMSVTAAELPLIALDISVLGPTQAIAAADVEVGLHRLARQRGVVGERRLDGARGHSTTSRTGTATFGRPAARTWPS